MLKEVELEGEVEWVVVRTVSWVDWAHVVKSERLECCTVRLGWVMVYEVVCCACAGCGSRFEFAVGMDTVEVVTLRWDGWAHAVLCAGGSAGSCMASQTARQCVCEL